MNARHPWIGRVLGKRYRIQALVHEGPATTLFRSEGPDGPVAVKAVTQPRYLAATASRLRAEGAVLDRLRGVPGVQRVVEFVNDGQAAALVLSWVDGVTADVFFAASQPSSWTAWQIVARSLAMTLHRCHSRGILHLDLKPVNILVGPTGEVTLIDFGIAANVESAGMEADALAGTLPYLPPERAMGEPPAATDDVYGLGVTLFELADGRLPFAAGDAHELQSAKFAGRFGKLIHPEAPPWAPAFFARLLAPVAVARPQSMREVLSMLAAGGAPQQDAGTALLRACAACHKPLVRTIPFCTHCGRPTEVSPKPGPATVICWSSEHPSGVVERLESIAGRRLGVRSTLFTTTPMPRVIAASVDEASADLLVAALETPGTHLGAIRQSVATLLPRLRLSVVQQAAGAGAALLFLIGLAQLGSAMLQAAGRQAAFSPAMAPFFLGLAFTAGTLLAWSAFSPLIPRTWYHLDERAKAWSPLAKARKRLEPLRTEAARSRSSMLIRRAAQVHERLVAARLLGATRKELEDKLAAMVLDGLEAEALLETLDAQLAGLRREGIERQIRNLEDALAAGADGAAIASRLAALAERRKLLETLEARTARLRIEAAQRVGLINAVAMEPPGDGPDTAWTELRKWAGATAPADAQGGVPA